MIAGYRDSDAMETTSCRKCDKLEAENASLREMLEAALTLNDMVETMAKATIKRYDAALKDRP